MSPILTPAIPTPTAVPPGTAQAGTGSPTAASPRAVRASLQRLRTAGRGVRWWFASVMGDNAYPRYLDHLARRHPGSPVPTEREYWRDRYAAMDADPAARCC